MSVPLRRTRAPCTASTGFDSCTGPISLIETWALDQEHLGSGRRTAARSIEYASCGVVGSPTFSPGIWAKNASNALRMLYARSGRHALLGTNCHGRCLPTLTKVRDIAHLIDYLVEGNEHEVRPHDLHDRSEAVHCRAEGAPENRTLRYRGIKYACGPKLLLKRSRHAVHAPGPTYIFSVHQYFRRVCSSARRALFNARWYVMSFGSVAPLLSGALRLTLCSSGISA